MALFVYEEVGSTIIWREYPATAGGWCHTWAKLEWGAFAILLGRGYISGCIHSPLHMHGWCQPRNSENGSNKFIDKVFMKTIHSRTWWYNGLWPLDMLSWWRRWFPATLTRKKQKNWRMCVFCPTAEWKKACEKRVLVEEPLEFDGDPHH